MHRARDALEVPDALLLEEQGEKVDLEEEVAELAVELSLVARDGRVRDLVRLLDRVRDDRQRGLLPVPRALEPQSPRQLLEVEERLRESHGARAYSVALSVSVSVSVSSGSSGGSNPAA